MTYIAKLPVIALLALALHVLLGWEWTIVAGLVAGFWMGRGGWHLGALGVGLEWLAVLLFNYVVASRAVHQMSENLGALLGNMPFFLVVALTVLIGAVLGLLGGAAGSQLARLLQHRRSTHAETTRPSKHRQSAGT